MCSATSSPISRWRGWILVSVALSEIRAIAPQRRMARGWRFLRALMAKPTGAAALLLVATIVLVGLAAPLIAPYDPTAIDIAHRLQSSSVAHWLGTDQLGRDVLSRLIFGTRTALSAAAGALGISLTLGLALGLIAGYGPKALDQACLLLFDSVMSLPTIIFALALVTLLGPGVLTVVVAVVLFTTPGYARVTRSQTIVLKRADYVLAARAIGASPLRILLLHILPNLIGPLVVLTCMDVTTVITIESGLSFIGLGAQPPTPSWGAMVADGRDLLRAAPWVSFAPGVAIGIAVLGFNLVGDALREAYDPRLRTER
jgi:peptide/nickel transport system permease protein